MTTPSEQPQSPAETTEQTPPPAQPAAVQPEIPKPDLAWMAVPTQRGMRAHVGPDGLRLKDVDTGDYGYVPDHWPYDNDLPRGSHPLPNPIASASYSLYDKTDVWSENAAELYEDAIRDRWASATDIPWAQLVELPEIQERALCQICTEISERSLLLTETLSGWLEKISYGFYEVKSFLGTQIFDTARHTEAFRKRALANGGGLGVATPAIFHRAVTAALKFTDLVLAQNIVLDTYLMVVLEALEAVAPSDAERTLFRLTRRDLQRHIDYGVGHVGFLLARQPKMHQQVHAWLSRSEMLLVADTRLDTPWNEALILLLGDTTSEGRAALEDLRRRFVAAYLNRLADARVYNRAERMNADLKRFLPEGYSNPVSVGMRPTIPDPLAIA